MISGPIPSPRMTVIVWVIGGMSVQMTPRERAAWQIKWLKLKLCPKAGPAPSRPKSAGPAPGDGTAQASRLLSPGAVLSGAPQAGASPAACRSAGQQRVELAGAVQRHHVVVATHVDFADEDLGHRAAPGARDHALALGGIEVDADLLPLQAAAAQEVLGRHAVAADRAGVEGDGRLCAGRSIHGRNLHCRNLSNGGDAEGVFPPP